MKDNQALKSKILRSGVSLIIRELIGTGLTLLSMLIIARILGPDSYGVVAIAVGSLYFTFEIAKLGLDVYVIREPNFPEDGSKQILTLYNLIGISLCGMLGLGIIVASSIMGFTVVLQAMASLIPFVWIGIVGNFHIAMLERNMRFSEVGWIDSIAQIVGAVFSVLLVLAGGDIWGPIIGQMLFFFTRACLGIIRYPISWHLSWRWSFLQPVLRYSLMYVLSNWAFALKSMTIPLFVGPIAGLKAVGILSLAVRFVDQIGRLRFISFRLSLSALSKLTDLEIIRRSISKGLVYQGLLVGPLYATFACCGTLVVPIVFGEKWLPSVHVFPYIAFGFFIYTLFVMHCSSLYVADRSIDVAKFHLWHVGLLWLSTCLLSYGLGVWGYPIAELIALLSYIPLHQSIAKFCGSPSYWDGFWLVLATTPALIIGPILPYTVSLSILIVSYILLFIFRPSIKQIVLDLLASRQRAVNE